MLLSVLVLSGCFQLARCLVARELSVIRHTDGDIFTAEGTCNGACVELSSGTGSPYARPTTDAATTTTTAATSTIGSAISITNDTCVCQCNGALPVFREDLHICVSDIHECSVAGLVSTSGLVEKVPYVFLPQRGQIIYPQSEIRFEGVTRPVCGIAGSQQLGKSGWLELRNLSNAEPPFRLFRDEGKTFLQWIGEDGLRIATEGKVVVVKLVCRDASPSSDLPVEVFTPCVAFRVAGSPSKSNIREVTFASSAKTSQGLSVSEYTAIGVSSVLLALIYVASVSLYLHSRKARRKLSNGEEPEVPIAGPRDGAGAVKNNPLLVASRHLESDTNSGQSDDDEGGDDIVDSDGDETFENPPYRSQRQLTSAIIHPHCVYADLPEQGPFGAGTILGERIPEEDVRIVETIENAYQHETPVLPGTQRRKLYFNPAYFERQLLLTPPPAAIEFLIKIREVISIAKHKMTAKRFVPTLTGIPEEDSTSERCVSAAGRQRASSVQGSVVPSRKSQRCTGCPGCTEATSKDSYRSTDGGRSTTGENRVRAWLEDVKTPERRWNRNDAAHLIEDPKSFADVAKILGRGFDRVDETGQNDFFSTENSNTGGKSLSTWKENPLMLRSFQNIARSEILGEDDRHSTSKRSTKSMFEESKRDRCCGAGVAPSSLGREFEAKSREENDRENAMSAKVREAIENSFVEQMEENAEAEDRDSGRIAASARGRGKKSRPLRAPRNELPDMINQLPNSTTPAKRIMDAVIRELVDAKALEHNSRQSADRATDYEIDSLERTDRKSAHPEPDGRRESAPSESVSRRNCCNNLPELLNRGREAYSLVSEVYVNDGYASPAGSDDSGPEISYEPENPGHLTIKVQDSAENYVRQDESEYEPDTLDRKPMRLKINGDVRYEREIVNETYVDSLERPRNILLRSRGSFRDDESPPRSCTASLQRGYGSLRQIYEAKLHSNLKDATSSARSLNGDSDNSLSWRRNRYLTPDSRQARRQRKPQNHPDVVPLPPSEDFYQKPKPPRRVDCPVAASSLDNGEEPVDSKNELDRSNRDAGDPTASDGSPVSQESQKNDRVGMPSSPMRAKVPENLSKSQKNREKCPERSANSRLQNFSKRRPTVAPPWKLEFDARARRHPNDTAILSSNRVAGNWIDRGGCLARVASNGARMDLARNGNAIGQGKVEDSGYLSSTDSNESRKQLLSPDNGAGSVSETDETESMCDGASESGAESVGTDSVFFGNFRHRRLSDASNFSKSVDSGVDFGTRNAIAGHRFAPRNEKATSVGNLERSPAIFQASDSESESFVTVLSTNCDESQRNSLLS